MALGPASRAWCSAWAKCLGLPSGDCVQARRASSDAGKRESQDRLVGRSRQQAASRSRDLGVIPLTAGARLDRRTGHTAVRTEHAAIPWERPETLAATLAVVKELAGVRRHALRRSMATQGTGNDRFKDELDGCHVGQYADGRSIRLDPPNSKLRHWPDSSPVANPRKTKAPRRRG